MTDHDALFQAVCASPDEDTPRLVFADWLEEHDQPERAEFIRIQCRRQALPEWEWLRKELSWLERRMLMKHEQTWRSELPAAQPRRWGGSRYAWGEFERGFVESIRISESGFSQDELWALTTKIPLRTLQLDVDLNEEWTQPMRNITRLEGEHSMLRTSQEIFPNLRDVRFSGGYMEADDLDWIASLAKLPTIRCHREGGVVLVRHMLENGWHRCLTHLELVDSYLYLDYENQERIVADEVEMLIASPIVTNLRHFHVEGADLAQMRWQEFFTSKHLSQLKVLDLTGNGFNLDGRSSHEPLHSSNRLDSLNLSGNSIGAGAVPLIRSEALAEIKSLRLSNCELSVEALSALIAAPCWQTLLVLDLGRNALGVEGMTLLAQSPQPAQLHTLLLDDCEIGVAGAAALATCPWLGQIRSLGLYRNQLGDRGVEALANAKNLNLRVLDLGENRLGLKALNKLAEFSNGLVQLSLRQNELNRSALNGLLKNVNAFQTLEELNLTQCGLGNNEIRIITGVNRFPALACLNVTGISGIAHDVLRNQIRTAYPGITVTIGYH